MSINRFKIAIIVVCLASLASGCRSMLEVPESARSSGYSNEEVPDGWLFDRVTGRKTASTKPGSSTDRPENPSGVQQASSIEPIDPRKEMAGSEVDVWSAASEYEAEEEDSGLAFSDFYPSNIVATVTELTGNGPNEAVARALYRDGEKLFGQKRYKEAAATFKRAAKRAPESPLQEDCLFMLGESYFFSDLYPKANDSYHQLLKKYDNTRHLDTVVARQFTIGRFWEQLSAAKPARFLSFQFTDSSRPMFDTRGYALKAYQSVRLHDPTGPLADDSIMASATAYFLKGRYEEAAHHYDLVRKEYPKSEHQLNAHLYGLQSKLRMYQGPMYDGTPLDDAGEIADDALIQFRGELGEERARLIQTQNHILQQKAERYWTMAQYFDKKKFYRSARIYYQAMVDEYPLTDAAQRANVRLQEISDLPDKPPNHFKWLTNAFPSTTR